jgi:hypothetical protein
MRTYKTEFPDFTLDVTIPKGFNDDSWKNDVCPSWFLPLSNYYPHDSEPCGLKLFIDYSDPKLSELEDTDKQFMILFEDQNKLIHQGDHFSGDFLIESDNYQEILNYINIFFEELAIKIANEDQAIKFLKGLIKHGLMFHLDDDVSNIIWRKEVPSQIIELITSRHKEIWEIGNPWVYAESLINDYLNKGNK